MHNRYRVKIVFKARPASGKDRKSGSLLGSSSFSPIHAIVNLWIVNSHHMLVTICQFSTKGHSIGSFFVYGIDIDEICLSCASFVAEFKREYRWIFGYKCFSQNSIARTSGPWFASNKNTSSDSLRTRGRMVLSTNVRKWTTFELWDYNN